MASQTFTISFQLKTDCKEVVSEEDALKWAKEHFEGCDMGKVYAFSAFLIAPPPPPPGPPPRRVIRAARRAIRQAGPGKKIQAIKLLRVDQGLGLKEAKDAVELVYKEPAFKHFDYPAVPFKGRAAYGA